MVSRGNYSQTRRERITLWLHSPSSLLSLASPASVLLPVVIPSLGVSPGVRGACIAGMGLNENGQILNLGALGTTAHSSHWAWLTCDWADWAS